MFFSSLLGNLYIADAPTHRVRRVSADGTITTVAGNGISGHSGDGGSATDAQLMYPFGLAVDRKGNLFIVDVESHRVRRVSPTGVITTVAGDGTPRATGDGGPATAASLNYPRDAGVDAAGNLFLLELNRVRKVALDGTINTVAGNGFEWGDGGPSGAGGMAVAADSTLYIASGGVLRKLAPGGTLKAVAGNGASWYGGDGGPVSSAQLYTECCASLA